MLRRLSSDIVLIDLDEDRAQGNVLDMNHGIAFFRQLSIKMGTYKDCDDASIVIVTAGMPVNRARRVWSLPRQT